MSSPGDIARKLGITVEATDKAAGVLAGTKREIAGIESQAAVSGGRFSGMVSKFEAGAGRMKSAIGGAASHFKTQMASIATASLAALGVGGLFAGVAGIGKSLSQASAFGASVEKFASVTGLAVPVASSLVDTLEKYGVAGDKASTTFGRLLVNTNKIAAATKGAAKFQKDYGFSILGANGHLADANTLLLRSADYFNNKNIPAAKKAAALQKLYGRSWQDLIPLLVKGRAGIEAEQSSSIKLTQTQLDNITKFRTAQREFGDTIGDLEVKIGANIMPRITDALKGVGTWLDTHSDDIATFFGNAADMAGKIAGTAIDVFGGIKAGWDSLPDGLKDLIVKGLVADRTVKFLFGFSPAALAVKLGEEAVEGLAKAGTRSLVTALAGAGVGKLFVQPVFVTNPGFGGGGAGLPGVAGGAAAAEAGGGFLSFLAAGALPMTIAAIAPLALYQLTVAVAGGPQAIAARALAARQQTAAGRGLDPSKVDPTFTGPRIVDWTKRMPARDNSDIPSKLEKSSMIFDARERENQAKLDAIRSTNESNAIELRTQQRVTASGDSAIVAAIRALRLAINLTIPVTLQAGGGRAMVRVDTGGSLSRTGQPGGFTNKYIPL